MNASSQLLKELPTFSAIDIEQVEAQLQALLNKNRQRIEDLVKNHDVEGADFLNQLEAWDDEIDKLWSPISHLNGVKNTDELRDVYSLCQPLLTAYATEMGQHEALYQRYRAIAEGDIYQQLNPAQQKALDNALRSFRLSGVALPPKEKGRYKEIMQRLSELSTQFSNNVLDATHGWFKHIEDEASLAGLPPTALQSYRQAASERELQGYVISLDIPAYLPAMQYADDRELRRELYEAYTTRASEQGPCAGQWDNSQIMEEILALRQEAATLLGFKHYAEYSLATKMAESPDQVLNFLNDLATKSRPAAQRDYKELLDYAKTLGHQQLEAWDIPYFSEKLRREKYDLSQEELRPYFPVDRVIAGMFEIVERLFGVRFVEQKDVDCWHEDASFYSVYAGDQAIAGFYLDLFARAQKRGGAWMANCIGRRRLESGHVQLPVAYLTCNFTALTETTPSLLTHNEVTTLFHEFGHGLHHMLTEIDCAAVAGIHGVAWDAVELPSQFLENWCWQPEAIPMISSHYETGEPLPQALLDKMLAAKNFQSGLFMVRQLEFALFDFRLHCEYENSKDLGGKAEDIQKLLGEVRQQVCVYPVPSSNRFQHSFSHIFAGGYAAGYYSYKWAELLSADAFSRFEEEGIFNTDTGQDFLQHILQQGGATEPMELFKQFRGREPSIDALLRHSGLSPEEQAA